MITTENNNINLIFKYWFILENGHYLYKNASNDILMLL